MFMLLLNIVVFIALVSKELEACEYESNLF